MYQTKPKTRRKATFLLAMGLLGAASPAIAGPIVSMNHERETIVLNVQGTTIEGVFRYIERHSSYVFAYDGNVRNRLTDQVNISLRGRNMETLIKELCQATGLQYSINGKQVLIKEKRQTEKPQQGRQPATHQVKGTVKDAKGEPLIGATIMIKGTDKGTVTDLDGNFALDIPDGATLTVSYVGFNSQDIRPGAQHSLNVNLLEDNNTLNELVVVGYGSVKKRDLTGAVSSVKSDEIVKTPSVNVMEAVQGKVAGFDITQSSGSLDSDMKMTLRGNRSIYGDNNPLVIIDGMEGSFDQLNPNDIASIEVLKDASSTAIYGAAGANGVIIITTKSPEKGKFNINFDGYVGFNKVSDFPEINSGQKYIDFRREAAKTAGKWSSEADDQSIWPSYMWDLIQTNQWVDWYDLATQTGKTQQYNLSTSYSNDRMSSFVSLSYNNREGIIKGEELKRYSARAKFDFRANKIVSYGINLFASYQDYDGRGSRVWNRILCTPPLGTPYNEDGTLNLYPVGGNTGDINPLADNAPGEYAHNVKNLLVQPQAYVELTPIKGLSFKSVIGGNLSNTKTGNFIGNNSFNGLQTGSYAETPNTFTYNYEWQNILTYKFKIGEAHDFTLTGVTDWEKNRRETSDARANIFDSSNYSYYNLGAGTGTPQVSSSYVQSQKMSYVARVNYSLLGRYLLTLSGRWDGSSMLAKGNKWDFFPAVAAAWRISDEPWMKSTQSWLSNLKLRLSYGVTGNAGAAEYATMTYSKTGIIGFQDVGEPYSTYGKNVANLALGWEKSAMTDIGLDLGLLKGRIDIVADWYSTHTRNLLFQRSLPYAVGGSSTSNFIMWDNVGKTKNTGFELAVTGHIFDTKNFKWDATLSFATNHEEVVKTTSDKPLKFDGYQYLIVGQPVHTYYLYAYDGIWGSDQAEEAAKYGAKPGQIRVADVDHNYKIDASDYQVIGHADPKWTGSLTNNFAYKGFDLSLQMIARWGWTIPYGLTGWYRLDGISPSPAICDYWTESNQGARYPQPNMDGSEDPHQHDSSLDYFDGSYVKIKNITLGYTFPKQLSRKIFMDNLRVYFTASNPFIFAKCSYLKHYDLEKGGDDDDAPLSKQFVFGVNITF